MSDIYASFAELQRHEPAHHYAIEWRVGRSGIAVIAPHGGRIEPGAMEIAAAVALPEHTFYAFVGRKPANNRDLHITSANFDEPVGLALVQRSQTALAIHGCGGGVAAAYVGGRDETLKQRVQAALARAGFSAPPAAPHLQGTHPDNICNRCRSGQGVQIELTWALRCSLFANLNRYASLHPTDRCDRFVAALRAALK